MVAVLLQQNLLSKRLFQSQLYRLHQSVRRLPQRVKNSYRVLMVHCRLGIQVQHR
jgi:hypothetical protein